MADAREPTDRPLLAVAILASFVAFLDGSVVDLALPAISRDFGGGLALQQWVVDVGFRHGIRNDESDCSRVSPETAAGSHDRATPPPAYATGDG